MSQVGAQDPAMAPDAPMSGAAEDGLGAANPYAPT
jgi:hypothetical protein